MFSGEVSSFSDLGNLILLDLSGKVKFTGETVFHYYLSYEKFLLFSHSVIGFRKRPERVNSQ